MKIFWISAFLSTGLFLFFFYVAEKKDFWGRQIVKPLVPSMILVVVSCMLVLQLSSAYYINEWAMLCVLPICVIAGPVLVVIVIVLAHKRLLYGPLICLIPIVWCFCWNYYARPDGFWVWANSERAYSSFFIPDKAENLSRKGPERHGRAEFQLEFLSEQTTDQLITFYTNKIQEAHFVLLGISDNDMKIDAPYYPYKIIAYQNRSGERCIIWIYENTPLKGFEHYRTVKLECLFNGTLLNPPSSVI